MQGLSYAEIHRVLRAANCLTEPAEAHGTLAGALCSVVSYRVEDWMGEILPDTRVADATGSTLRELFAHTSDALNSADMSLDLLLPEEERPLTERAEALGQWCQGFLYGLGSSRIADLEQLPGEVGEVVRDLVQITRVGVDHGEAQEANESAYAELVEFVRVGVQLVYEELAAFRDPPERQPESGVLH
jgi:hypothetical protein